MGTGIGTDLRTVDDRDLSGMPVLLVNPLMPVSTAAIFQQWDAIDRGGLQTGGAMEVAQKGRNDLKPVAIDICPEIADILEALEKTAPILFRMSGSGATCFALYGGAEARQAAAVAMNPSWWTLEGKLR